MPAPEENTCLTGDSRRSPFPQHTNKHKASCCFPRSLSHAHANLRFGTEHSASGQRGVGRARTKALLSGTAAKGRGLLCQRAGTPREGGHTGGTYASGKRRAQAGIKGNGTMPWSTVSQAGPGPRGCAAWETAVAIERDGAAALAGNGGEEPLSYCLSSRHQRLSQSPHACLESWSRTGEPGSAAGP